MALKMSIPTDTKFHIAVRVRIQMAVIEEQSHLDSSGHGAF